ncbi:DMT family transporter [Vibrio nigripulchritudo]|uniref:DMT family transporter n=1 Tax=Vibrio nigripulchritudo TaxID=28173 RepID=UPI0003B1A1F3|nr:SMR family transporter [Vibrio nigripulchritudo]CCN85980.1 Quaternary ammonium compound-resistance protein [Vibrio nigripulchritudo BLFn1]CCN97778.1 Quaternary ammonium compound-resistance protein [Vibrio nigripulchritudo ENn2]CCO56089.1 Quaternary ammonium compound-resistance protein [Vibrio nigripulchritudo Wn13]
MLSVSPLMVLFLAIVLEVAATTWLPKTQQFTALLPTLGVLAGYGAAFYLLSVAVNSMSLGVVYAIWCGAGMVLVSAIAWWAYDQALDIYALMGIGFILTGTILIQVFSDSAHH